MSSAKNKLKLLLLALIELMLGACGPTDGTEYDNSVSYTATNDSDFPVIATLKTGENTEGHCDGDGDGASGGRTVVVAPHSVESGKLKSRCTFLTPGSLRS